MAQWKKREGTFQSVAELVSARSGMSMSELTSPAKVPASEIVNIPKAAGLLTDCLLSGRPVVILGDYDADGITSTAILVYLLRFYGVEPKTIIPRRFTDGYGISARLISKIHDSLLICVDNGIAAPEVLQQAHAQGNLTMVLDHHLADTIPEADVVVDPHVTEGESGYVDYCGAGLALKLAEQLLPYPGENRKLFYNLTVLACIGTITDVMPLTGDNRRIVKEGLQIIRSKKGASMLPAGLLELLKLGGDLTAFDEETVKFTIGPIINAPGRMYDAGSSSTLKLLLTEDQTTAVGFANKMKQINDQRKSAVSSWQAKYLEQIDPTKKIQVLYLPGAPEGILGIIAGNITEQARMPAFVFTDAQEDGIVKGSGRTFGDFVLYDVLPVIRPLLTAGGGHAGAAGISTTLENFAEVKQKIEDFAAAVDFTPGEDVIEYDMEISSSEVPAVWDALRTLGPFGEGCEMPVLLLRNFRPVARYGEAYSFMGADQSHLKLYGTDFEIVAFGKAEQYRMLHYPDALDLVATVGVNVFRGKTTVQLSPLDFRCAEQ